MLLALRKARPHRLTQGTDGDGGEDDVLDGDLQYRGGGGLLRPVIISNTIIIIIIIIIIADQAWLQR